MLGKPRGFPGQQHLAGLEFWSLREQAGRLVELRSPENRPHRAVQAHLSAARPMSVTSARVAWAPRSTLVASMRRPSSGTSKRP